MLVSVVFHETRAAPEHGKVMPDPSAHDLSAVSIQILLSLVAGARHGYGIKLDVEERTDGAMSLGSGTLYQALARLEDKGLIETTEPPPDSVSDARRGRFYDLRPAGREALQAELTALQRTVSSEAARAILGASGEV